MFTNLHNTHGGKGNATYPCSDAAKMPQELEQGSHLLQDDSHRGIRFIVKLTKEMLFLCGYV